MFCEHIFSIFKVHFLRLKLISCLTIDNFDRDVVNFGVCDQLRVGRFHAIVFVSVHGDYADMECICYFLLCQVCVRSACSQVPFSLRHFVTPLKNGCWVYGY